MSQLDDLKAAQAATATALTALATNVGEIKDGVVGLDTEVKALITLIGSLPSGDVPPEVVAAAQALQATSEALVTQTQAVEDQIKTVPPVPAAG